MKRTTYVSQKYHNDEIRHPNSFTVICLTTEAIDFVKSLPKKDREETAQKRVKPW